MTEAEWLACTNPQKMLEFLRGKAGDRKLRLFAVACCRRIWHLFRDDNNRRAVEVSERLADGLATNTERRAAALAAGGGTGDAGGAAACAVGVPPLHAAERASEVAASAFATASALPLLNNYEINPEWQRLADAERASQCNLLRDIFGTLAFLSVALDLSWLARDDRTVPKLAQAIYEERAFDRLPILADALEEAGCMSAEILSHLRGPGPHVRGCWVVDLILGNQ
jgi:hypothetical protein